MKKLPGKLNEEKLEKKRFNIVDLVNDNLSRFLVLILIIQLLTLGSMVNLFTKVNQSHEKLEEFEVENEFEIDINQLDLEEKVAKIVEEIKDEILTLQLGQVNLVNETNIKQWINEAVNESLNNELTEMNKDFGEKFEDMTSYFGEKVKETIENINDKVNNE